MDHVGGNPRPQYIKAGGGFGLLTAFLGWYNALAGLFDAENRFDSTSIYLSNYFLTFRSFPIVPVLQFPWSEKGRQTSERGKRDGVPNQDSLSKRNAWCPIDTRGWV